MVLTIGMLDTVEVRRDGDRIPMPASTSSDVLVRLVLDATRPARAPLGPSGRPPR